MASKESSAPALIGHVASRLTELPPDDLNLVVDFVDYLEKRRRSARHTGTGLGAEARHRASLLNDVPREQLVSRFAELADEVRQEAIKKGTAVEGDWMGD